ncbi:MAG: ring-hydroxylating dioxygenase subunit beta [Gammaproteobacteria bacterium]|nr:MAG: ring-hydroxylating dioxygenase subunit beta [Gammaproteobacteria bacterium]RLA15534.1 MAG: ring-hydroxylating dioxygenase subunit beta [Gammaproteobacteria bacterium]
MNNISNAEVNGLRPEIENFLYREARMMDKHQFDDWEAMWSDKGVYWVPCAHDSDPMTEVSIIYANRAGIATRLGRMRSKAMYVQDPRSICSRIVGNIEVYPGEDGGVTTYSTFNITEFKRRGHLTHQTTWSGHSEHKLSRHGDQWLMDYKKVTLLNSDGEIPALGFLV